MAEIHGSVLSSAAVAKRLRVEVDTVRKWVQRGLLSPADQIGRAHIFSLAEVERFQRERRKTGRPSRIA